MSNRRLVPTLLVAAMLGPVAGGAAEGPKELSDAARKRVVASIEHFVREDSALKGAFLIVDPRSSQPLALTFDHVHSGVKPISKGYLACVDFKDAAGRLYDVDVVVELDGEASRVQAVRLHKVDGKTVGAEPK